jgi:hypothetical protein
VDDCCSGEAMARSSDYDAISRDFIK